MIDRNVIWEENVKEEGNEKKWRRYQIVHFYL